MLINKQHKCQGRAGEKTLKIFPMLKLLNVLDGLVSNGGCSNSSLSVCHGVTTQIICIHVMCIQSVVFGLHSWTVHFVDMKPILRARRGCSIWKKRF